MEKENVQIGQLGVSRIQAAAEQGSTGPAKTGGSSGVLDMLSLLTAWLQPQGRELAESSQNGTGADAAGTADLSESVPRSEQGEGDPIGHSSFGKEMQTGKKKDKDIDMDKLPAKMEAKQAASAPASGASADILSTAAASMPAPSPIPVGVPERKEPAIKISGSLPPPGTSAQPVSGQQMQPVVLGTSAEQQSQAPKTGESLAEMTLAATTRQATAPQALAEAPKGAESLRKPEMPPVLSAEGAGSAVPVSTLKESAARQSGVKSKIAEKMSYASSGIAPAGPSGGIGREVAAGQSAPASESMRAAAPLHASVFQDAPDRNAQQSLPGNPFERMDSVVLPQTTLLRTSPHHLAVGVRDPALGWVEVQTQSSSGHLSASLTTTSASSHAALAGEAPALTQFLVERNVPVQTVSVAMQGGDAGSGQQHSGAENRNQQDFPQGQGAIGFSPPEAEGSEERNQLESRWSRLSVRA